MTSNLLRLRRVVLAAVALGMLLPLLAPVGSVRAWEQPTHSQINYEAARLFLTTYANSGMDKYRLGTITREGLGERLPGIAVAGSSLLIEPFMGYDGYMLERRTGVPSQWIAYGGDWADEPHLYASVRHFYDPLSQWGVPYLTDQYYFHGWYDDPKVDARTWALDHPDNPFSFVNALRYYKAALEVPETGDPPARLPLPDHFKLNLDLAPADRAEERRMYLALAYRALGETMHLLGDMTQPAHVRNDAHALDEPIEKAVKRETVRAYANHPVDAHVAPYIGSAGGQLQPPDELFRQVARFTNRHFYSADTIYDAAEGVIPQNVRSERTMNAIKNARASGILGSAPSVEEVLRVLMENARISPYPAPQFSDLIVEELTVEGWLFDRTVKKLYAPLVNDTIPVAQERLSTHWFDPDMTWKEKAGRLMSRGPYHVPTAFADDQARVLMPVAIRACADLMHHFYPTLALEAAYEDLGVVEEAVEGRDVYSRQVIEIEAQMRHRQAEDTAWAQYDLDINYTGPAELLFARGNEIVKTRELYFEDGQLATFEDHEGRMVEEPLRVYVAEPGIPLIEEEAFYELDRADDSRLMLRVKGGSRVFRSPIYDYAYEEEKDITGKWDGFFIFDEATKLLRFVEDVWVTLLGPVFGEEKAREAFHAGVETPGLGRKIPLFLIIEAYDAATGACRVTIRMTADDGALHEDVVEATYRQGVISFTLSHADGSRMDFEGVLVGEDALRGAFGVSAWGIVQGAASGSWEVVRVGE